MRIIAIKTLKAFWEARGHDDAERSLRAWIKEIEAADWKDPGDIKAQFRSASVLQDGRVVFDIHGNRYRLVVWINFAFRVVYIRFVGTHEEYDGIDAQTV